MDAYHLTLAYAAWSAFWGLMITDEIDRIYWETDDTFLGDMARTFVVIVSAGVMIPAALIVVLSVDAFEWIEGKVRK